MKKIVSYNDIVSAIKKLRRLNNTCSICKHKVRHINHLIRVPTGGIINACNACYKKLQ